MLGGIGLGLSAISSVAGLLATSGAQKAAQERRDSIIQQLKNTNAREYLDTVSGNNYSLAQRSGGLNNALESTGRSLGAANAAAGVTNNSAVAGSLGLGAQGIQKKLADYALRNKFQEQSLLNDQQRQTTGLELGGANSDLNYQRDQTAGYMDSFGNLLSGIGQLGAGPRTGGGTGGILPVGTAPLGGGPGGLAGDLPAMGNILSGISGRAANPLQSMIQTQTQKNRKGLGGPDIRTMGNMVNGGQGGTLPGF